jgi:hypothetical protein
MAVFVSSGYGAYGDPNPTHKSRRLRDVAVCPILPPHKGANLQRRQCGPRRCAVYSPRLPLFLSFRRRVVAPLLLGAHDVVAEPQSLVLRHTPRSGCLGIIAALWLIGWCFGLIAMCREALRAGSLELSTLIQMIMMAAVIFAGALYVLYQFTAIDELRVDGGGGITYRRRVIGIVVLRRWTAPLDAVYNIDLSERRPRRPVGGSSGPPQPYALLVSPVDERPPLSYAEDAMSFYLVPSARALRERVEMLRGYALPPAPVLERAAEQVTDRHERAIRAGLDAVGAASMADLDGDPARKRQAMRRVIERHVHDAMADEGRASSPPRTHKPKPSMPPPPRRPRG